MQDCATAHQPKMHAAPPVCYDAGEIRTEIELCRRLYATLDNETAFQMSKKFGVPPGQLLHDNKQLHEGLTLHAKLFERSPIVLPLTADEQAAVAAAAAAAAAAEAAAAAAAGAAASVAAAVAQAAAEARLAQLHDNHRQERQERLLAKHWEQFFTDDGTAWVPPPTGSLSAPAQLAAAS